MTLLAESKPVSPAAGQKWFPKGFPKLWAGPSAPAARDVLFSQDSSDGLHQQNSPRHSLGPQSQIFSAVPR